MFFLPLGLTILDVVVNFGTEYIQVLCILSESNALAMVGNFSAVFVVSQLPNFYFDALKDDLKDQMEALKPQILYAKNKNLWYLKGRS